MPVTTAVIAKTAANMFLHNQRILLVFGTLEDLELANLELERILSPQGCTYNPMMRRWSNDDTRSALRLDCTEGKPGIDRFRGLRATQFWCDEQVPQELSSQIEAWCCQ